MKMGKVRRFPRARTPPAVAKLKSTNEEVLPDTILNERSPDSSVVENVAQLAKLYGIGTPSEKEFQTDQGANPSVIRGILKSQS